MQVDTLVHARWVIPVEPREVLQHHSLAMAGTKVVDIVPTKQAREVFQARETYNLPQHALIPGLINAHTHAAMSLFRGIADDLPLMEWLNEHVWPAEQKWVSAEFVRDGALHAVAEMLRGGTTCFNDMYFFPDETARVASEAGIRACVGLILIDFPSPWATDAQDYFRKGEAVHDRFRDHPLVSIALAPHAPYSVSDEILVRVRALAEELDLPIHMHVHETEDEVKNAVARTSERPLQCLSRLGLLSPRLLAVHATQLRDEEIATLARYGVYVVHCPESNLKLASGFCPVAALTGRGVGVALGTDGPASNKDLDMFGEMRVAALLGKAVAGDARALDAHAVLTMATLNGARALGLDSLIGSLRPGKAADIVAVDLGDIETQPIYDPLSQLIYAAGRDKVSHVWVAGRQVVRERALLTLDKTAILERTMLWQERLAAFRGEAS
ncbi:MAG: TRZ/ATZ family hydrolase [Gammaproteobacteria bacterium]